MGIVYNPLSIAEGLNRALDSNEYTENDLVYANELYHSWGHHGQFSGRDKQEVLDRVNLNQWELKKYQNSPNAALVITFGSAWVYEYQGEVVANCHKIPSNRFTKRLLPVDEIVTTFNSLIERLAPVNIILTVSPVRYIRDGLHESTLSKSVLHLAVDQLQKRFENVHYFPAYEILIDELRDYRFYAQDLVHPNDQAIEYIWSRFLNAFGDEQTQSMISQWEKLFQRMNHRPLHSDTEAYKNFTKLTEEIRAKFNREFGLNA
jgi:hypothetical protein